MFYQGRVYLRDHVAHYYSDQSLCWCQIRPTTPIASIQLSHSMKNPGQFNKACYARSLSWLGLVLSDLVCMSRDNDLKVGQSEF